MGSIGSEQMTEQRTVLEAKAAPPAPSSHGSRASTAPPTVRHDDAFISYERMLSASEDVWPARKEYVIPEFTRDANPDDVVEGLRKVGGVVVRGILSAESLAQMEKDIRPHLEADVPWEAENNFFPPSTRRAFGLCAKSRAFATDLIGNELYQAVCEQFLTTKSYPWYGDRNTLNVSPPQVNNTIAFSVRPGNSYDQPLHRDDDIHYADRPRVDVYPRTNSREYGIGFFVAGTKTTRANGATRFIPGSHLEATEHPADERFARYAELNPGDGFIMLSSCYHGGSANTTKDEERLLFSCFMTRGWLRQEENQYLAVPPEVAKTLPVRIQKLLGYALSDVGLLPPFLRFYADTHPLAHAGMARVQRSSQHDRS
jgi:ectoine hydroxylase-related dioxygenase (phytanoyl-CoA dioxygenase family)